MSRALGKPFRCFWFSVWTAGPTARATLATFEVLTESDEVRLPCLLLLDDGHPTDPFITGEWGEVIPDVLERGIVLEYLSHISWYPVINASFKKGSHEASIAKRQKETAQHMECGRLGRLGDLAFFGLH